MSSTELTPKVPKGISIVVSVAVAAKEPDDNPVPWGRRLENRKSESLLRLHVTFVVKERCEKNENDKHVSGVVRLVVRPIVRAGAAGR